MIMHLYLLSVICVLATALPMDTSGYPQGSADWFQSSHWLDKIPSIEVKVKPDGITVRTGPSQEDIYWIIGYVVLGIILFTLFALAIGFCIYCVCWKERQGGSSRVIVREVSNHPNSRFSNPFPFTRSDSNNVTRTQFTSPTMQHVDNGISMQQHPRSKQVKNINNTGHHSQTPPPPYRSRN